MNGLNVKLNCYFIRDKMRSRLLVPYYTWTSITADIFTKPLGKDPFYRHISKLGVIDLQAPP